MYNFDIFTSTKNVKAFWRYPRLPFVTIFETLMKQVFFLCCSLYLKITQDYWTFGIFWLFFSTYLSTYYCKIMPTPTVKWCYISLFLLFRRLILWVNRNTWLWAIQVSVAIISLSESLLLTYLGYKVNSILILGHFLAWDQSHLCKTDCVRYDLTLRGILSEMNIQWDVELKCMNIDMNISRHY